MSDLSDIQHVVDLNNYPIGDLQSTAGARVITACRQQLHENGLCLLEHFVQPEAILQMQKSAIGLVPKGHYTEHWRATPNGDSSATQSTLAQATRASMCSIAYDCIDDDAPLRALYSSPQLTNFLNTVISGPDLYTTADPLISCMLTSMDDGDELGWHYDPNDVVVSLSIQSPDAGGEFEVAPQIRYPQPNARENEAAVLAGNYPHTLSKSLKPGTLSLFNGHRSLHRVAPVIGDRQRIVALFNYSEVPYYSFDHAIQRKFFGRVAQ